MRKRTPIIALLIFLIAGCISMGKPSPVMKRYTLEYPPPVFNGLTVINETLKVERFSTARAFNGYEMIYRPEPFRYSSYNYSRWISNPGDMVTDFLTRDLRESGLFSAIFSSHDADTARFRLEGSVSEFFEDDGKEAQATLSLHVLLLDLSRKETDQRVVFRKTYRFAEPCNKTPEGLARGMSAAMEKLATRLIEDIHNEMAKILPPVTS